MTERQWRQDMRKSATRRSILPTLAWLCAVAALVWLSMIGA